MHIIHSLWKKKSIIMPIPKKNCPVVNCDRPIALNSNIMKSFERLVVNVLKEEVKLSLGPFQFA